MLSRIAARGAVGFIVVPLGWGFCGFQAAFGLIEGSLKTFCKTDNRWSIVGSPTSSQSSHTLFNQPFGGNPPPFHFIVAPIKPYTALARLAVLLVLSATRRLV